MNILELDAKEVKELVNFINETSMGIKLPVNVITERLHANPLSYLEYGAWWWEVKRILRENGTDFGSTDDERVREQYKAVGDVHSLASADMYRDAYLDYYFVGNRTFTLKDGSEYTLYDADMEMLAYSVR